MNPLMEVNVKAVSGEKMGTGFPFSASENINTLQRHNYSGVARKFHWFGHIVGADYKQHNQNGSSTN